MQRQKLLLLVEISFLLILIWGCTRSPQITKVPGTFLCGVCMFSSCVCVQIPPTVQRHADWGQAVEHRCECECECQLGLAPAPPATFTRGSIQIENVLFELLLPNRKQPWIRSHKQCKPSLERFFFFERSLKRYISCGLKCQHEGNRT